MPVIGAGKLNYPIEMFVECLIGALQKPKTSLK